MLTKEKLESWYTPRHLKPRCECLTEEEELVAEDIKVCDICDGSGETYTMTRDSDSGQWVEDKLVPCICQLVEEDYEPEDRELIIKTIKN